MRTPGERFFSALEKAGMPGIPAEFSVATLHQEIPRAVLSGIDAFVRIFDAVTARPSWREAVTKSVPEIARRERPETCFFSAWDFHLPPDRPDRWQLIEFNDNGSGFLFAGLINRLFYELSGLGGRRDIEPPLAFPAFADHVLGLVEREARAFFGEVPRGLFLVLDGAESLERGKFQRELSLLRDLFRGRGWKAEIASPAETQWDGGRFLAAGNEVSFIVNRSTDFLWESEVFAPVRDAYREGRVYMAPNPFTYVTRSDKQLIELLSRPHRDAELGIRAEERAVLSAHVPETWLVRDDNLEELARRREELVFKPIHGFAGRGLLESSRVGRSRLRRLLRQRQGYVAQQRVPKPCLTMEGAEGAPLWTDLRVWAYRGERFLVSGRASRRPDILDLTPPGGWLPTFALTP
jgi:hypothetical protein